jgi:hypothetical protein
VLWVDVVAVCDRQGGSWEWCECCARAWSLYATSMCACRGGSGDVVTTAVVDSGPTWDDLRPWLASGIVLHGPRQPLGGQRPGQDIRLGPCNDGTFGGGGG